MLLMYYGVLVMVVCDSEGIVYDLRFLVDSFGLMGDRGYRGCEYVRA